MQVFNVFFKIAKKHLSQLWVYVGVFLVLIGMMSFSAKKSQTNQFSASSVDIAIIDKDNSTLSKGIYDYLDSRHNIVKLKKTDKETLTDSLFYQRISYVLIIPDGFEASFLSDGNLTLTHNMRKDSASGFFVNNQIDSFMKSILIYSQNGYSIDDAINTTLKNLNSMPATKTLTFEETSNGGNDTMFYYFQYMGYIFLMIFAVSLVPILVTLQQKDLSARITCSALSARSRNFQIGLGCICYSIIIWSIFIILSVILFRTSNVFSEHGLLCIINSFVYLLICTSITLLLSTFNIKDHALHLISNILGLGMGFLCGIFVPQSMLAPSVLKVGKFFPAYWYIKVINMVTGWYGDLYSIKHFWMYIGIECIFLVAIFSVYLVLSQQRKRSSIS